MEYSSFQDVRENNHPVNIQPIDGTTWPHQQGTLRADIATPSLFQTSQVPSSGEANSIRRTLRSSSRPGGETAYPSDDSKTQRPKRGRPRLDSCTADKHNPGISQDELSALREYNLEKNRVAAEKCRLRRKKSTAKLSADFDVLSQKNEALKADEASLREELLFLKNKVLSHASCGSPIIDGYIAQSAEVKLGTQSSQISRNSDQTKTAITYVGAPIDSAPELNSMHQEYINSNIEMNTYDFLWPDDDEVNTEQSWQ